MRIVSLEPYLTDTIVNFGLADRVVGISRRCVGPESLAHAAVVTAAPVAGDSASPSRLADRLCADTVLLDKIRELRPTHIITGLPLPDRADFDVLKSAATKALLAEAQGCFTPPAGIAPKGSAPKGSAPEGSAPSGTTPVVLAYAPATLPQIFESIEQLAKDLGSPQLGLSLAQRMKAQLMDWGDNFYDRMKNKRVTFLTSVAPLRLGGRWIPDLIHMASCLSQEPVSGGPHRQVSWEEVLAFRPDVIVVAPFGLSHDQAMATFKVLEKIPDWEKAPAVRRGEVFFTEGERLFNRPGPSLLEGMGILVSSIAGIDSGYITKRDSFQRLRFLEMQRHRY